MSSPVLSDRTNLDHDASLALRNGDQTAIEAYEQHDRIHAHADQDAAIETIAEAAIAGVIDSREVLVMAATNSVVDTLNETITDRLFDVGWLDLDDRIEIGGHSFYPGQPVVTRANERRLTYGPDQGEWVRNGDRWTVDAGTRDELYVTNLDSGDRHAIPADHIAAGNVTVDDASTINRAQGVTVDVAHLLIDNRTNAKQLYVGTTRGRNANHVHDAPPAFDSERHGPVDEAKEWTATGAVIAAVEREPGEVSAAARRRRLRCLSAEARADGLNRGGGSDRSRSF